MSYDIWIVTEDIDHNRVDVPIVESQYGLSVLYTKALRGKGIDSLDATSCRESLPEIEDALLNAVKYRKAMLQLVTDEDDGDQYAACLQTLMRLVELAHKHPSGFVRVAQ